MIDRRERTAMVLAKLADARLGARGWYRMNCCFCEVVLGKADKRWSLGVAEKTGFFHCFKCGTAGRVPVDPQSLVGMSHDDVPEEPTEAVAMPPPAGYAPLWCGAGAAAKVLAPARAYLNKRGFGKATWEQLQLGGCASGWAGQRIIIPVFDREETMWLGWIARDWTGQASPKYLYPSGMPRGTVLFQHASLFVETDEPVLVVEGSFDLMPYIGHAVACLGKPSKWQVEAIKAAKRPIVVALDGDAWEEAYALSMRLRLDGLHAGFVRLPAKEDPCSMAQKMGPAWLLEEARRAI